MLINVSCMFIENVFFRAYADSADKRDAQI